MEPSLQFTTRVDSDRWWTLLLLIRRLYTLWNSSWSDYLPTKRAELLSIKKDQNLVADYIRQMKYYSLYSVCVVLLLLFSSDLSYVLSDG